MKYVSQKSLRIWKTNWKNEKHNVSTTNVVKPRSLNWHRQTYYCTQQLMYSCQFALCEDGTAERSLHLCTHSRWREWDTREFISHLTAYTTKETVIHGLCSSHTQNDWSTLIFKAQLDGWILTETADRRLNKIYQLQCSCVEHLWLMSQNVRLFNTKSFQVTSRFSPDLDAETLSSYLTEKLGRPVQM